MPLFPRHLPTNGDKWRRNNGSLDATSEGSVKIDVETNPHLQGTTTREEAAEKEF